MYSDSKIENKVFDMLKLMSITELPDAKPKNLENFPKNNFDRLNHIVLNELIHNMILYLRTIYLKMKQ